MLRVTPDEHLNTAVRAHRFASQVLHRVDSFVAQEEEVPLWQALSIAFAESLEVQAAAALASLPEPLCDSEPQPTPGSEASYAACVAGDSTLEAGTASPDAGAQDHAAAACAGVAVHGDGGGPGSPRQEEPSQQQPHQPGVPEAVGLERTLIGNAANSQADMSVDRHTTRAESTGLTGTAASASAAPPADHAAAVGDADLETADTAGKPRRVRGFEALQVLLEQRLMPQELAQRSQSARPARGGKRRARGARRWVELGWDPEAAARLRWSYDGGVGYGVPALELEELLELEAQTREVARAAVAEFAAAKRRHSPDQVCCELYITLATCDIRPERS